MEEETKNKLSKYGKNDFEYIENLAKDHLGELYRAKNINDNNTYLIRTLIMKQKINKEIKDFLEIMRRVESSKQKKKGLSKYYGFYLGATSTHYNLIFEDIYAFPDNDSRKNDWKKTICKMQVWIT